MEYIHIRSLEKYHPGYKDRNLHWCKIYFKMVNGDPDCELITNEIDWARLVKMIVLELQAQKPLPNLEAYWIKKGFDIKKRPMSLTLQLLHNFIEVVTEDSKVCNVDKSREDKIREDKIYVDLLQTTLTKWNSLCDQYPILNKINIISETRRKKLKQRVSEPKFVEFDSIIEAIKEQPFLINGNPKSKDHANWRINFDWLIANDTNYLKVLERRYKNDNNSNEVPEHLREFIKG